MGQTRGVRGYGPATYGDAFADVYDDWYAQVTDAAACAARCASLAAEGADGGRPPLVLELGVGTGRLALPLRERGCDVRGIDASPAMLARLRTKPGGDLPVRQGDLADVVVPPGPDDPSGGPPPADLVLCAYNTLFNLEGPEAQRRCLAGVARVLRPGGRLVVEAFVPPTGDDLDDGSEVRVRSLTADAVVLTAAVRDPAAQTVAGQFIELSEAGGVRLRPWRLRYLHPAQLDALAAGVGLVLEHRWAGWAEEPFDDGAEVHVSVYRSAAGDRPGARPRPAGGGR